MTRSCTSTAGSTRSATPRRSSSSSSSPTPRRSSAGSTASPRRRRRATARRARRRTRCARCSTGSGRGGRRGSSTAGRLRRSTSSRRSPRSTSPTSTRAGTPTTWLRLALNAKLEAELAELEPGDRDAFLAELGVEAPALARVTPAAYRLLDLISFFTAGPKESRAWTIRRGQSAREAAGKIHSDLERGFIRAEVIRWDELVEAGSVAEAQKRGLVRVEGRDYVVRDGDVLNVRFNV
jgi:hypothetical protein